MRKQLIVVIFTLFAVLSLSGIVSATYVSPPIHVEIGVNQTFTDMNFYQDNSNYDKEKTDTYSWQGNSASVSTNSNNYDTSHLGVSFDMNIESYDWKDVKNIPIKITYDINYNQYVHRFNPQVVSYVTSQLMLDWGLGQYCKANPKSEINSFCYKPFGTSDYSYTKQDTISLSNTNQIITIDKNSNGGILTLEDLNWYSGSIDSGYPNSMFSVLIIHYGKSGWSVSTSIKINSIKLEFLSKPTPKPNNLKAEAGDDQNVYIGDVVSLDGSKSSPSKDITRYNWTFTQKPTGSTATLSDSSIVKPKFTPDKLGEYIAQLIVENSNGVKSQPDTVKMTVTSPLTVALDYKRDLTDYKNAGYSTKDEKTVYGGDTIILNLSVKNNSSSTAKSVVVDYLMPKSLAYISQTISQGTYSSSKGKWQVGDLKSGATATLKLTAKVVNSGEIINTAAVSGKKTELKINVKNPVILVHGFNSSPSDWNNLIKKLKSEGIRYYAFDYSKSNKADPSTIVSSFSTKLNDLKTTYGYKTTKYQGKFDIVCHSMGALITRYYMENNNNKNAANIGQWIGIGPVNQGAAIMDVLADKKKNPEIYDKLHSSAIYNLILKVIPTTSNAALNMRTTDYDIVNLNKDGIAPGVKYRLILGTNVREIPGLDTVEKINNTYRFTTNGDGIVANTQSMIDGAATTYYVNAKHTALPSNSEVINIVLQYLKNS